MAKILEIKALYEEKINEGYQYNKYDGFEIKTDKGSILIAIDSDQGCCESFGSISSVEDFSKFIGTNILSYRCIDQADYKDCELTKNKAGDFVDVFDCAFVDFMTDKGTLQFAVYNHHNGYYGHHIILIERIKK